MPGVTITINDRRITTATGVTILMAARTAGIHIPTLCYHPRLRSVGACRVCVVEVRGKRTLVPSCTTPVQEGMVIHTESKRVVNARRMVVQLLLASGDHNCLTCQANGACELQDLAYSLGIETLDFTPRLPGYEKDQSNTMIERDPSKCILCGRCVRACHEVQVNEAIDFGYRGIETKVITEWDRPLKTSRCVFCGACLSVCPTGAIIGKQSKFQERPWKIKKIRTTCVYCGTGCQLDLNVANDRVVSVSADVMHGPPNYGFLCVKGMFGHDFIHHPDRLQQPLVKKDGVFTAVSWDEALGVIADRFTAVKTSHGPDALAALSSARCTNEENYLLQKIFRAAIGTNNIDHCARLCHASTVSGLAASFGSGAMTNPIADLEKAGAILVTGANPTEMHPVIGSCIKRAVRQQGTPLVVVDPRRIDLVSFAHTWLRPKPGTDVAWINGLLHVIFRDGLQDEPFMADRTEGVDAIRDIVSSYHPGYVEKITGIPAQDLEEAARIYARTKPASIVYAMGITQHTSGTDNVMALANLAMACGNLGVPGGGLNPLRGQNNVQGACDMGALPNVFSGYQAVTDSAVRTAMAKAWGTDDLPQKPGLTITEIMEGAVDGTIQGLFIMGENPMLSDPDLHHVETALRAVPFLVVQDIFLTETAQLADVVLPAACFAEKDGTFTNTERRVQRIRKAVSPPGQARSDWEILCDLSSRLGFSMHYKTPSDIMNEIATVTPSYGGVRYQRIHKRGLPWPCPAPDHPGTPRLHEKAFTRGKGRFHPVAYVEPLERPDSRYPLYLSTGRILYHWHTGTMTRRTHGLVEKAPECEVEISPSDARRFHIDNGTMVTIASRRGAITAKARITERAVRGTIFVPFHFAEAAVNRLTHRYVDPVAKIPGFKVCAVRISKRSELE